MQRTILIAMAGLGLAGAAPPVLGQQLLMPGGPYEASAVPADARGEWLALVVGDGSDRLAGVRVSVESVTEECTGSPGAAHPHRRRRRAPAGAGVRGEGARRRGSPRAGARAGGRARAR